MNKISIIIPVYFNSDTLMTLYEDMKEKILDKLKNYELVFVDDGSEDNSWEIINQIQKIDSNVCSVKLSRNFGEHAAILAGLSVCSGDCAVTKQADLQEDSELILDMFESWKRGNKVVLALRKSRDENPIKVFFANFYYTIVRNIITKKMPKGGFDCFLADRQVIDILTKSKIRNSSLMLELLHLGFQTDYIYFNRLESKSKKSRWTFSKKMKLVFDSIFSFSLFPMRIIQITGIILNLISVISLINIIVKYLVADTTLLTLPLLITVIIFCTSLILLACGILGEYVWRGFKQQTQLTFIAENINKSKNTNHS